MTRQRYLWHQYLNSHYIHFIIVRVTTAPLVESFQHFSSTV